MDACNVSADIAAMLLAMHRNVGDAMAFYVDNPNHFDSMSPPSTAPGRQSGASGPAAQAEPHAIEAVERVCTNAVVNVLDANKRLLLLQALHCDRSLAIELLRKTSGQ
jgi:hypothetical protein